MPCLLLLLLLPLGAQAQRPFSIRHLGTRDGLSQGSCFYIRKDSRGFVWVSSQNGLNRFDGTSFTNYRFDERDVFWVNRYNRQKLAQQRRLLRNTLATQEDERRRIARDLHDDVGNTPAAIKGVLERASARIVGAAELPEVAQAYDMIDKAGNDRRAITHDLMPVEFEQYALPDVVAQLVERANRSSRTAFEFIQFGPVRRLKPERELVTYRIIAELIQNALKHGGSGVAIVQLGLITPSPFWSLTTTGCLTTG